MKVIRCNFGECVTTSNWWTTFRLTYLNGRCNLDKLPNYTIKYFFFFVSFFGKSLYS